MKLPNKTDLQQFLDSDRAILIVCMLIALVFWMLVKLSLTFTPSAEFRIYYKLPAGKAFVSSPPASVKATLKGTGWDLISYHLQKSEHSIQFEINDVSSQGINASLIIDKIQQGIYPPALKVSDVNTDFIFVQMEDESEIKVPVKLNSEITFSAQTQLMDSIAFSPDSVIITGPLTEVKSIEFWETEPLKISNLKKSTQVNLRLKAPKNNEIHLSEDSVSVKIPIEEFTEKSVFVPITIQNAPDSLKTFPETVKLSFIVGLSKFNQVNKSSFQLVADLKDIPLNTEKNTVPVNITRQPDFVRAVNFQPKSVEFFFVETLRDTTVSNE